MGATDLPPGYGFPVAEPTISYWQTPPDSLQKYRSTEKLPEETEFVVIGSGVVGSLIAYKILQRNPQAKIVMLEARDICSGATGRNGGHCQPGWFENFASYVTKYGAKQALLLSDIEETSCQNLISLIKQLDIKCGLRAATAVYLPRTTAWLEELHDSITQRESLAQQENFPSSRFPKELYSAAAAEAKFLIPGVIGAVTFQDYVLNPYRFVCGLLNKLISADGGQRHPGFNIQSWTRAESIFFDDSTLDWSVRTERGTIRAPHVLLATNAYTPALLPWTSDAIIPTRAQIAVVRPGAELESVPDTLSSLEDTYLAEEETAMVYWQTRRDSAGNGEMVVGGGRTIALNAAPPYDNEQPVTDDASLHPYVSEYLTTAVKRLYGEKWKEEKEVLMEWTGIMGYTKDKQPLVGEAYEKGKGLWVCAGFHGHGMAMSERASEAVVELLFGGDVDAWLPDCWKVGRFLER